MDEGLDADVKRWTGFSRGEEDGCDTGGCVVGVELRLGDVLRSEVKAGFLGDGLGKGFFGRKGDAAVVGVDGEAGKDSFENAGHVVICWEYYGEILGV